MVIVAGRSTRSLASSMGIGAQRVDELVNAFERDLSLTPGFLETLLKENDWSFVVKLHALYEAAVGHLIVHALGQPKLGPVVAQLELSNPSTGKLAFARELDLLSKSDRRLITLLSQIRNRLVHDVTNVDFSFEKYFASLDANQKREFLGAFEEKLPPSYKIERTEIARDDFVRENQKMALWFASMSFLAKIYKLKEYARLEKLFTEVLIEHTAG